MVVAIGIGWAGLAWALSAARPLGAQVAHDDSLLATGRQYTKAFFAGDIAGLESHFSVKMHADMDSTKLRAASQQVADLLGGEHGLISEELHPLPASVGPWTAYQRTITVDKIAQPVEVRWVIGSGGEIGGFYVRPAPQAEAPSTFLAYVTKTPLRLPFTGDWLVLWGGRTVALNRHASSPDERFAYDFLIARNGVSHSGAGHANTDYYAFGQPVLSPAAGTVIDAVDGIADNEPGTAASAEALGNHVIIDHGDGEFSFLAHLQHGSVTVHPGDHVDAGTVLGRCGNSGNSTEPHLHYHLQSTQTFQLGAGMPAQFEHYAADGTPVARGEPTRGQVVHPS
jgi:murein DD-endopeptidase MepM/ murein hydrolase activator NlpD